jgi:hypothetical protein
VNYACCENDRKDLVAADAALNGIDYLEVIDHDLPDNDPLRQCTLLVHFLKPLSLISPGMLTESNIQIKGGERITGISVLWAAPAVLPPPHLGDAGEAATAAVIAALTDQPNVLVVRVDEPGDYSTYTLSLVTSPLDDSVPTGFDTELADLEFSFKIECPSDFDCKPLRNCCPPAAPAPDIDYLAKDYPSFRRLLLNRIAALAPQWLQNSEADTGIAVVELLAYVGDQLSYQQDAIGTEAYLETARRRISLRRHAVLVDYAMHDGCNARSWLQLQVVPANCTLPLNAVQFLTRCKGFDIGIVAGSKNLRDAMLLSPTVFEPVLDPRFAATHYQQPLYAAHNQISFYTWSGRRCCLPTGATSATLDGQYSDLNAGDVLLFEEVLGPITGVAGDADPGHRQIVRLTSVSQQQDDLNGKDITVIEWNVDDALPFPLCISGTTDEAHGSQYLTNISIARGNVILIDNGQTLPAENLPLVPAPTLFSLASCSADRCNPQSPAPIPARYRPVLSQGPLTQAGTVLKTSSSGQGSQRLPFDPDAPAVDALNWALADVLPVISLSGTLKGITAKWQPQRTLLSSSSEATDFVVEVDDDGAGSLRFGDDEHGVRPEDGTQFTASYRIGNGSAGNVGAESIVHIVAAQSDLANISLVRNPQAASGGIDAESMDSMRRNAPQAFRIQERAVTPDDYAAVTERYRGVQRAAATMRWTGSWYTATITVDPDVGVDPAPLKQNLQPFVDGYRMAGQDLAFNDPVYVSLEIGMHVCVDDDYFRSDVKAALLQLFSNQLQPDGTEGLFYPDNFTFGQTVYLSPLYAAAHAIPGVAAVQITAFGRQGDDDPQPLLDGYLKLNRLEIARLDNDPNFPEHGVLDLDIHGGK